MTGSQRWVGLGVVVAVVAIAAYFIFVPAHKPAGPPVPVTIAVTTNPDSALVHVAELEGYFRDEGLAVTLQKFTSGKASLEAVMQGKAQLATVAETPIVLNVLKGKKLSVIAGIFHSDKNMGLVARRDRGISTPRDLRGKTIGTPLGTNAQYFLHALLVVENVPESEVTVLGMAPEATEDALMSGRVDAVAVWNPFLLALVNKLGDGGATFYGDDVYTYTFNVVSKQDFTATNPQAISAFLRALLKAEVFVRNNPAKARQVVATFSHWDESLLDKLWGGYRFRVSIDQGLLVGMGSQARWALDTGLVQGTVPNFVDMLYLEGLQRVAPQRITIAR